MLVLIAAPSARLDAGSVGLALARKWADTDAPVLFVDADTAGTRLAQRFGDIAFADFSPADRGLPSLIAARDSLTLRLLADHCYSLDTAAGSLWALFAPSHPDGGVLAAQWLAERTGDLAAVDRERSIVLSSWLSHGAARLTPLVPSNAVLVVLAPVAALRDAHALGALLAEFGLTPPRCPHRALIVEGHTGLTDEVLAAETGLHVAGRLQVVDDETVLRLRGGRRERAFLRGIDDMAARLLSYSRQVAAAQQAVPAARPPQQPLVRAGITERSRGDAA
ncbi:hypothetical protein [Candidatus Poriferisodalis sp.]|uniref:hypothetical protein n=1 Tax=Candidatus Poriferisodalis sp. TaxID=3101277 RepID=UPI003B025BC8